jgi:hypothetical protein
MTPEEFKKAFRVGDKVALKNSDILIITAIGEKWFLAKLDELEGDDEEIYRMAGSWQKVEQKKKYVMYRHWYLRPHLLDGEMVLDYIDDNEEKPLHLHKPLKTEILSEFEV